MSVVSFFPVDQFSHFWASLYQPEAFILPIQSLTSCALSWLFQVLNCFTTFQFELGNFVIIDTFMRVLLVGFTYHLLFLFTLRNS